VFQGERELCQHNKLLGEFNLEGIAPARRGLPQIEVTFDIDANGIMHISAKDKSTGKENKITIKSNSGLSEAEIEKMIREAEENAEADKVQRELIETRNSAEAQMHEVKKDLEEFRSELTETEIADIEKVLTDVETARKGDDVAAIKAELEKAVPAMAVLLQKRQLKEQGQTSDVPASDDVVDATFTEKKAD
jgi:molecular chaperone DnaK